MTSTLYAKIKIKRETDIFKHLCRGWLLLSGALDPPRTPATVLGCLCRKHFPGLVDIGGGTMELAYSWKMYEKATDDEQPNKQERVLADFWVSVS
jgi:hypothetical protein